MLCGLYQYRLCGQPSQLSCNLPGQAFTEWSADAVLNNEYYAECLDALAGRVRWSFGGAAGDVNGLELSGASYFSGR